MDRVINYRTPPCRLAHEPAGLRYRKRVSGVETTYSVTRAFSAPDADPVTLLHRATGLILDLKLPIESVQLPNPLILNPWAGRDGFR